MDFESREIVEWERGEGCLEVAEGACRSESKTEEKKEQPPLDI